MKLKNFSFTLLLKFNFLIQKFLLMNGLLKDVLVVVAALVVYDMFVKKLINKAA